MMTLPYEEQNSLNNTRNFLTSLLTATRIPKSVRMEARACLRHYPSQYRIEELYKGKVKE
jgi:hypothetical protein